MVESGYQLQGSFMELCDCFAVCPCWVGQNPTEDRCTGAFGWVIEDGQVGGIEVGGLRVVSVSFHSGHRDAGGQEVYLFVDENASDTQFGALVELFTGQRGGPLGELGTLMGVLRGSSRAPIGLTVTGKVITITVGHQVTGDAGVLTGQDGQIMELAHGRLAQVLGTPAEIGVSSAFHVDLGGRGFSVDVTGRAAMRGRFRYEHAGTAA